jgi:DNA-binding PadR family transcriptional regulator
MRLSEFEQVVLLAVLRVGDDAYGARLQRSIAETLQRSVSVASLYVALSRMESHGLVASWMSDPTPVRGGRSKRCYRVEPSGMDALAEARDLSRRMWDSIGLGSDVSD